MSAKITIDLNKIHENAVAILNECEKSNISITAVTKMHCADLKIAQTLIDAGIEKIADSRIENLKKLSNFSCEKWLLRLPAISEASEVICYADVSLNSEITTIEKLDEKAALQNKTHGVILLYDLGDLREGYFNLKELIDAAGKVLCLKNIELLGIGTALSCYGGILPTEENLNRLLSAKEEIERRYNIKLKYVSGGSSTSFSLVRDGSMPEGINNLRIGDSIYIGRDDFTREYIPGLNSDCFCLTAEIIEIKKKPSVPIGISGYASLNRKPHFEDKGEVIRAILSVGRQDIDLDMLPEDPDISLMEASSDHLLVDITNSAKSYKIGDKLTFKMQYTSIMRAFTSKYIIKEYV